MSAHKDPQLERRSLKRFRASIEMAVHDTPEPMKVSTNDICQNGLSCCLPMPLTLFTKYRFRLFVPDSNHQVEEIDGEGIVVRVEEVEEQGENLFQTAFYFQHLDPGHLSILEDYLELNGEELPDEGPANGA